MSPCWWFAAMPMVRAVASVGSETWRVAVVAVVGSWRSMELGVSEMIARWQMFNRGGGVDVIAVDVSGGGGVVVCRSVAG